MALPISAIRPAWRQPAATAEALAIAERANIACAPETFHEVALPDPLPCNPITIRARAEDAEDRIALDRLEARLAAAGPEEALAEDLPIELVKRLSAGEHPIRVWRAHRGLTREALAATAGIAPSSLSEIETGRKPGSFEAIARIAAALRVSLDDLAAWLKTPG